MTLSKSGMRKLTRPLPGVVCGGMLQVMSTVLLVCAAQSLVWAQAPEEVTGPQELIERYCSSCHNDRLQTAGLSFDRLDGRNPSDDAEVWERIILKLRSGAMPPAGRPRPEGGALDELAAWLETELDVAALINPNPGRTATLHRLNRAEYRNVVRDLLAVVHGLELLSQQRIDFLDVFRVRVVLAIFYYFYRW